jgi:hypothetical protein
MTKVFGEWLTSLIKWWALSLEKNRRIKSGSIYWERNGQQGERVLEPFY